jgi:hypothetical protein
MKNIQGSWLDEAQHIYRAEFAAGWSWDDYHLFLDELPKILGNYDGKVHMIVVYLPGSQMPDGTARPHHGRSAKVINLGITVSVTDNALIKAYVRQSQRMLGRHEKTDFAICKTLEEAQQFIISVIS